MAHSLKFMVLLTFVAITGVANATCEDIKKTCHDAYMLDSLACQRNYSGQQRADCERRAARQFESCVKGHGCPLT